MHRFDLFAQLGKHIALYLDRDVQCSNRENKSSLNLMRQAAVYGTVAIYRAFKIFKKQTGCISNAACDLLCSLLLISVVQDTHLSIISCNMHTTSDLWCYFYYLPSF